MKLIVGLGNPGLRYEHTRHNAGYKVIDLLAGDARCGAWSSRCRSLVSVAILGGHDVVLAKPVTFMNASGEAVRLLSAEYRVGPDELTVVLDDLDLPLGRIRIRQRGSAGGHHGMESVIRMLESDEILRVRLGIGEEDMPEDKAGFVLSDVPAGRTAEWNEMIARAAKAVQCIVADGASRAMSMFNA